MSQHGAEKWEGIWNGWQNCLHKYYPKELKIYQILKYGSIVNPSEYEIEPVSINSTIY